MSYFEDFEEDKIGDIEYSDFEQYMFLEPKIKYTFQRCKNKWTMRNGQEIDIKDMKTTHIINSLNMVLKICNKEGWKPNKYSIYNKLRKELESRKK
ncbi:hypothetical protein [Clostridium botulinum]|uniref:hypothetical protein n=1 Tax=Clostridium botulinum TaxID=1491 RepID=UPI001C9A83E7|nr:hypothetical protein [Clostridium botulinum]MBY6838744.1 hypothetical protein [Clostridium botulinum]